LKSFWRFHSQNVKLAGTNLTQSLFVNIDADYLENSQVSHLSGSPASLQNASHSITGDYVVDHWTTGDRNFELRTLIRRQVSAIDSPVLTLADLSVELTAHYATAQPVLQYDLDGLKPGTLHEHTVVLAPRRALTSTSPLQQRTLSRSNLTVQTSFYWPAPPSKGIGEKTAPLIQWKETRIDGLTSQPIILRGEYSQTYRPGHHNFSEEFIFEPALEEGLSAEVRNELQSANVQFIYVASTFGEPTLAILSLDGKFRFLP